MKYLGQVSTVHQRKTMHWVPSAGGYTLCIEVASDGLRVWKETVLLPLCKRGLVYSHPVDLTNCDTPVVLAFLAGAGVLPLVGDGPSDFDISPDVVRDELTLARQAVAELRESDDAENHAVADTIENNIPVLQRYAG